MTQLVSCIRSIDVTERTEPAQALQYYRDLHFIRQLLHTWELPDTQAHLDSLISEMHEKVRGPGETMQLRHFLTIPQLISLSVEQAQIEDEDDVPEYLSRMQVVFAPLFPPPEVQVASSAKETAAKSGALLCYAPPAAEQHFQPALDLVKPSARFGLLLVGSSNAR